MQLGKYPGRLQYHLMEPFIDQLEVLGGRQVVSPEAENSQPNSMVPEVIHIHDYGHIDYCNSFKKCFLLLFDGSDSTLLEEKVLVLQQVHKQKNNPNHYYGFVDAKCHANLFEAIGIQERTMPQLVMIQPESNDFVSHIGTISAASVSQFVNKVTKTVVPTKPIQSSLYIHSKDCQAFHQE